MCSNTSSSSYGDWNDYSGGCLKKQKTEKVPRRGPGVAELEKILREQDNQCIVVSDSSPPFFSSSNVSSLPESVLPSVVSDQNLFCPNSLPFSPPQSQSTYFYSNRNFSSSSSSSSNRNNDIMPMGVRVTGNILSSMEDYRNVSGLPFSGYLSNGSIQNDLLPPPPVFQRKPHSLHQTQMMNLPGHVAVRALSNPSSLGMFQFIEAPCHNNALQRQEKEKLVGAKRPRHLLMGGPLNHQIKNPKCNSGPTNNIFRDAIQNKSLDLRLKSFTADCGPNCANSITSGSSFLSTLSLACPRDLLESKLFPLPFQCEQKENIEEQARQRSGTSVSINRKPFYRFLSSHEQNGVEETAFGLSRERCEANGDHGIDLSLKL